MTIKAELDQYGREIYKTDSIVLGKSKRHLVKDDEGRLHKVIVPSTLLMAPNPSNPNERGEVIIQDDDNIRVNYLNPSDPINITGFSNLMRAEITSKGIDVIIPAAYGEKVTARLIWEKGNLVNKTRNALDAVRKELDLFND